MNNAFFKFTDFSSGHVGNHRIDPHWWSRRYEYPWALQFAKPRQFVADMGCGWWERPLKHALADVCGKVLAIDARPEVMKLTNYWPLAHMQGDFSQKLAFMPDNYLDVVFCISVLEDLDWVQLVGALSEFRRVRKLGGLVVVTFDVPHNSNLLTPFYPGLELNEFRAAAKEAGLEFVGDVDDSKKDIVYHSEFNLCVFHGVLR